MSSCQKFKGCEYDHLVFRLVRNSVNLCIIYRINAIGCHCCSYQQNKLEAINRVKSILFEICCIVLQVIICPAPAF